MNINIFLLGRGLGLVLGCFNINPYMMCFIGTNIFIGTKSVHDFPDKRPLHVYLQVPIKGQIYICMYVYVIGNVYNQVLYTIPIGNVYNL